MKTTKEMIEVMQAFEEGKTIIVKSNVSDSYIIDANKNLGDKLSWDWGNLDYSIKPELKEPTYRPYERIGEMLCDYNKRVCRINNRPKNTMPLIWLKGNVERSQGLTFLVSGFDSSEDNLQLGGLEDWFTMAELFRDFAYMDGTPFGKQVEE